MSQSFLQAPGCWRWRALFSHDLKKTVDNIFEGFVWLDPKARHVRLIDAHGYVVDARPLKVREFIRPGSEITFPCHRVKVQRRISLVDGILMDRGNPVIIPRDQGPVPLLDKTTFDPANMLVHASRVLDLDFSRGQAFAKEVWNLFRDTVHPTEFSEHFTLVVSFGRASFRLDEDTVSLALEAVLGGFCGSLHVTHLRDRVFSFRVSSKAVGFHVLELNRFVCFQFKCFFHLWGFGGPNWQKEFKLWNSETENDWTTVRSRKVMQKGYVKKVFRQFAPRRVVVKAPSQRVVVHEPSRLRSVILAPSILLQESPVAPMQFGSFNSGNRSPPAHTSSVSEGLQNSDKETAISEAELAGGGPFQKLMGQP